MTQIEKISAVIKYMETGFRPTVTDGMPTAIFDTIDGLNEDKKMTHYRNFVEFLQPLLQRTSIMEGGDKPKIGY